MRREFPLITTEPPAECYLNIVIGVGSKIEKRETGMKDTDSKTLAGGGVGTGQLTGSLAQIILHIFQCTPKAGPLGLREDPKEEVNKSQVRFCTKENKNLNILS